MGLLAGGMSTGFVPACMLNNAGGAWDNAKKYIERGVRGGRRLPDGTKNPVHGAAVIGDTVGDPCKDTCGPSLNILIKLMAMVSGVFTPVVVKFAPVVQEWLHIATKQNGFRHFIPKAAQPGGEDGGHCTTGFPAPPRRIAYSDALRSARL
jgi:hypothetical protein